MLPIETARGCWWGMKKQCVFCGLNRNGMIFRARAVDGTLGMIGSLSDRYDVRHFYATDNNMPRSYERDLFQRLGDQFTDLKLHYNVRPDFSHEQLRELRKGGLFSIQPGIESLCSHSLRLMNKPTTAVKNLELIKWATYYGIANLYNLLTHVAGETVEDYEQQARLIPLLHHLQPPTAISIARADRSSPMYRDPQKHGIRLWPRSCYAHLFPPQLFDLTKVAYFFDQELLDPLPKEAYFRLNQCVQDWKAAWQQPNRSFLRYEKRVDRIHIYDGRTERPTTHVFTGLWSELYEYCADARAFDAIQARFEGITDEVETMLAVFVEHGLLVVLDDKYLSLALPMNPHH